MKMPHLKDKKDEKRYKEMYERDHKMVKGKFSFLERPGDKLVVPFQKYPGDPLKTWTFYDGMNYEVPYMLAKHLALGVSVPVHKYEKDASGKQSVRVGRKVHRTNFQKLDFEDDEFVQPNIITVENVEPVLNF